MGFYNRHILAHVINRAFGTELYFRSTPLEDPESGRNLGELYAETLFFEDIVKRASQRIGVYREKLQIDLSKK